MNNVSYTGRLTADPKEGKTANGATTANFRIAVAAWDDDVDFIPCTAYGKTAEFVLKYMRKGTKVEVCGKTHTWDYEDGGQRVYRWTTIVSNIEFAESKKAAESNQDVVGDAPLGDAPADDYINVPDSDDDLPDFLK